MSEDNYRKQVRLLLQVMPVVAQESCFALHGGTAINLFVRNLPRVSVDIDLTYLPLEDRATTLGNISNALESIKSKLLKIDSSLHIEHMQDIAKLLIRNREAIIKLEVNIIGRGVIGETKKWIIQKWRIQHSGTGSNQIGC